MSINLLTRLSIGVIINGIANNDIIVGANLITLGDDNLKNLVTLEKVKLYVNVFIKALIVNPIVHNIII